MQNPTRTTARHRLKPLRRCRTARSRTNILWIKANKVLLPASLTEEDVQGADSTRPGDGRELEICTCQPLICMESVLPALRAELWIDRQYGSLLAYAEGSSPRAGHPTIGNLWAARSAAHALAERPPQPPPDPRPWPRPCPEPQPKNHPAHATHPDPSPVGSCPPIVQARSRLHQTQFRTQTFLIMHEPCPIGFT